MLIEPVELVPCNAGHQGLADLVRHIEAGDTQEVRIHLGGRNRVRPKVRSGHNAGQSANRRGRVTQVVLDLRC